MEDQNIPKPIAPTPERIDPSCPIPSKDEDSRNLVPAYLQKRGWTLISERIAPEYDRLMYRMIRGSGGAVAGDWKYTPEEAVDQIVKREPSEGQGPVTQVNEIMTRLSNPKLFEFPAEEFKVGSRLLDYRTYLPYGPLTEDDVQIIRTTSGATMDKTMALHFSGKIAKLVPGYQYGLCARCKELVYLNEEDFWAHSIGRSRFCKQLQSIAPAGVTIEEDTDLYRERAYDLMTSAEIQAKTVQFLELLFPNGVDKLSFSVMLESIEGFKRSLREVQANGVASPVRSDPETVR